MKLLRLDVFKGPIARGTTSTTSVLAIRLAVQAGTLLLVARMLGPQQFGAFAGIAALAVIVGSFATFGTHLVLLGEISKEPGRRDAVLAYALPVTLLCGSALTVIYLLSCVFALREAAVPVTVLLAIGTAETLLQPLFRFPAAEQLALGHTARSQLLTTLPLALRLAAAAAVFLLAPDDPLSAYGYGYFAASLLAFIIAAVSMPAPWPAIAAWRLPRRAELREALGYAALNVTAASPAELDKTLATKLLPHGASGLYAAAARIVGAATLPVSAMMLSALPRLFREGQSQPQQAARLLRWVFAAALGYSVVLAALLWFMAPAFLWLFGPTYDGIEQSIRLLTLAVPGLAMRIAAGNALTALGKPWNRVLFEAIGLLVLAVSAVMLVPRFGASGMPVALACSEWSMAITGWMLVRGCQWEKLLPATGDRSQVP